MPLTASRDDLDLSPLWTDAPDALARLEERARSRRITRKDAANLRHFIERGWLVMPGAIEPALIDTLVANIHAHHDYPGLFVKTDHRNNRSQLKLSDGAPDRFESLFDLYVNFDSARRVCLHPAVSHFLRLVFEEPALAFQQLLFQRSNGHQFHADTAFVAVEDPLRLVATWIALEDVVEGSGELAFYDRSHALPHYVFADGSKRSNPAVDDMDAYVDALEQACRERDLPYERFLARKGDVFFWSADLVHRSHPRTLPEDTSRLSCVTHYCPVSTAPFWARFHPDNRDREPFEGDAIASLYYRLPNFGQPTRPNRDFS